MAACAEEAEAWCSPPVAVETASGRGELDESMRARRMADRSYDRRQPSSVLPRPPRFWRETKHAKNSRKTKNGGNSHLCI